MERASSAQQTLPCSKSKTPRLETSLQTPHPTTETPLLSLLRRRPSPSLFNRQHQYTLINKSSASDQHLSQSRSSKSLSGDHHITTALNSQQTPKYFSTRCFSKLPTSPLSCSRLSLTSIARKPKSLTYSSRQP